MATGGFGYSSPPGSPEAAVAAPFRSYEEQEVDGSPEAEVIELVGSALNNEMRGFLKRVWRTKALSDLQLVARGHTQFDVHKFVLAAHSVYFHEDNISSVNSNLDVNPRILELVLEYLYLGTVQASRDDIQQMHQVAKLLGIRYLQDQCQYLMLSGTPVTMANCLEVYGAAHTVQDKSLCEQAGSLALGHLSTLQHTQAYLQLSYGCVRDYLCHPQLRVTSPDERLAGALIWLRSGTRVSQDNYAGLLQALPLHQMHGWFLDQLQHDPLISGHPEALHLMQRASWASGRTGASGSGGSSTQENCFVAIATETRNAPTDEVFMVHLDKNLYTESLGRLGVSVSEGTRCCIYEGQLYVAGCGQDHTEIWKFDLVNKTSTRFARMKHARHGAGMVCTNGGILYIIGGGYCENSKLKCSPTVEAYDLQSGTSTEVGSLWCFDTLHPKDYFTNLACHYVADRETIIVCGAYDHDKSTETIQMFSLREKRTTHCVSLPEKVKMSIYSIIPVATETFVGFSWECTFTFTISDIENRKPGRICMSFYEKSRLVPRFRCGVATGNEDWIYLIGGHVERSAMDKDFSEQGVMVAKKIMKDFMGMDIKPSVEVFMYRARGRDITSGGRGWQKMDTPWKYGPCKMFAFDTAVINFNG